MNQPEKIIRISKDDIIKALEFNVSHELLGKLKDELKYKADIDYNKEDEAQHLYIADPSHPITLTRIKHEEL